ncbi:hypothetical protein D3C86_1592010 [compost metagenome]
MALGDFRQTLIDFAFGLRCVGTHADQHRCRVGNDVVDTASFNHTDADHCVLINAEIARLHCLDRVDHAGQHRYRIDSAFGHCAMTAATFDQHPHAFRRGHGRTGLDHRGA